MTSMNEQQLGELGWSDLSLRSIAWTNEGRDLVLAVRFGSPPRGYSGSDATLTCSWASDLRIDMKFGERVGGHPVTWDVTFKQVDGRWSIDFDFASTGHVSLWCNDIEIVER